jgi:hypothetical protein
MKTAKKRREGNNKREKKEGKKWRVAYQYR